MKLAILACLAALCLTAPLAQAAPGDAAQQKPTSARQEAPKADTAKAEPPKTEARAPGAPVVVGRDKRRRSYAACNRASHQRGYRGGKRRRFLIRCRLGYERTRAHQQQQQQQQAPVAPAPAPARKP
ncbi:hypothetical protein ACFQE0_12930 [Methylobacterium komagatae]|uniref:Serine/threonine protein kinase n=1 Tax=Methylobacterium komagatae TaxID=374425 RepID=A0ABW2BK28_9HYPH